MNKRTVIPVINVLLAYAQLQDSEKQLFNNNLNEFVFASPARKREFVNRWQEAVAASAHLAETEQRIDDTGTIRRSVDGL